MAERDDLVPGESLPNEDSTEPEPPRMSHQEMLDTLGVMARQLVDEAPDALKETTAVAAEWTAHAARSSTPYAHKLADVAEDASLRLAKRSERLAADIRADLAEESASPPDLAHDPDAEGEEANEGEGQEVQ